MLSLFRLEHRRFRLNSEQLWRFFGPFLYFLECFNLAVGFRGQYICGAANRGGSITESVRANMLLTDFTLNLQ